MANSQAWSEPGASWASWSDPEKLYTFDPIEGWSEAQKEHLLGEQCCIWSEPMTDRGVFDRLVFPGLSALAENGWTRADRKSFARFEALVGLMPILYGILRGAVTRSPRHSSSTWSIHASYRHVAKRHVMAATEQSKR